MPGVVSPEKDVEDHGAVWRSEWAAAQTLRAPSLKDKSVFYRNIEEELDLSRQNLGGLPLHVPSHTIDFSTCDVLGLGHNGILRKEFLKELEANPNFHITAGGSRLCDGTSNYQAKFEKEIADLIGVESALVVHSGWTANQAIFSTVPRSGDVIVYDELMHATALAGMKVAMALDQRPFRHNDLEHFIEILEDIKENVPLVKQGKRCVIIGVESYYSMDGDICPLREMIDAAKDIFPNGNAQFIVDEAHSFGCMGPNGGLGFVKEQGLEDEVAIRMITLGKALAASGGEYSDCGIACSQGQLLTCCSRHSLQQHHPLLAHQPSQGHDLLSSPVVPPSRSRPSRLPSLTHTRGAEGRSSYMPLSTSQFY